MNLKSITNLPFEIFEKSFDNFFLNLILVVSLGSIFALIACTSHIAVILICCLAMGYIFSNIFTLRTIVLTFIVIYPLLPVQFGVDVGHGLPVFKAPRMAMLILMYLLLCKGIFFKCIADFFNSKIYSLPILLLMGAMLATSFNAGNFVATLYYSISFFIEFIFFAVISFSVFKNKEDMHALINAFIISTLILCLIGFYEKITGFNPYSVLPVFHDTMDYALEQQEREGGLRVKASFDHAISFGAYLVMILPIILYKFKENFTLFSVFLGLITLAVLTTISRSAIIGVLITLAFFWLFVERKYLSVLIFMILFVFCLYFQAFSQYLYLLNPFTTKSEVLASSSFTRINQFSKGFDILRNYPVFGTGSKSGIFELIIDNYYLTFVIHFGLLGFVTFVNSLVNIIVKPVYYIINGLIRDKLFIALSIGIMNFYIMLFIVSLMSFHYVFWIYVGLIARLIFNYNNDTKEALKEKNKR